MSYIWPLVLIVVSNSIYHICAKSLPAKADPFAALTITYFIGTVFSAALYFLLNRGSAGLVQEWKSLNWTPYVLGFIVVAIEAGNVYAYRAGWSVNTLPVVQSAGSRLFAVPRGHHPQQAHRPCLLRRGALFPQQMSCAAPTRVV